ncbi:MAG: cysteine--tRNA ligase [Proteobacteria bacterium]|nr:cysteine--tRNA ligase [Pseudomonadota bacterium]
MSLKVYNTLVNRKEPFIPLVENQVGMYVCGPTVYDVCHMGHARASIVFDVIFRYLKYVGYHVTYVRNITDIDDKIINKANDEGVDYTVITERYTGSFHDDMLDLGNLPPTYEPKATEHIKDIIGIIQKLINKGFAYEAGGDVYYSVDSYEDYGKLSGRKTDDLIAGARVEVGEKKKNPLDFALWKMSKEGEPSWESPWGKGRPGWHIECSAMSAKHLGETFDIHGGGKDLIFPHHENEVAQSQCANGKPFAKYWIHNGFVTVNEEKMSKSLGNFFTIRDLLGRYHSEVVRLFLLTTHYRSPIDYSDQNLNEAETALEKIYSTLNAINAILSEGSENVLSGHREGEGVDAEAEDMINSHSERFCAAMDDDFNSALAIAAMFDTIRAINRWINASGFIRSPAALEILTQAKDRLVETGNVLGMLEAEPVKFHDVLQRKRKKDHQLDAGEVDGLVAERWQARLNKNWKRSDEIRDRLASMGVILKDGAESTSWEVKR